jgi:hypothetical protein
LSLLSTPTLIGLGAWTPVGPPSATRCSLGITSSLGPPSGSPGSPTLVLRPSTGLSLMVWLRRAGYASSFWSFTTPSSGAHLSTATTSAPSISLSTLVQHQRMNHVEIYLHFVREHVAVKDVRVHHVTTHSQFVDIFTKGLPLFLDFRSSQHLSWLDFRMQGVLDYVCVMGLEPSQLGVDYMYLL